MVVKARIYNRIQKAGVIAVIRGHSEENSYLIAKACIAGKLSAIEVAFTSPNADKTIEKLSKEYLKEDNIVIGAGTILDATTARLAIVAGTKFIVSPSFNKETAMLCNLYQIPYIPGCFTATEIQQALTYGAEVIKMFPSSVSGPSIINEINGPFPNVNIMPTGGISLQNMNEWLSKGAFAIGVGGSLVGPGDHDDYKAVKDNAKQFHEKYIAAIAKK